MGETDAAVKLKDDRFSFYNIVTDLKDIVLVNLTTSLRKIAWIEKDNS